MISKTIIQRPKPRASPDAAQVKVDLIVFMFSSDRFSGPANPGL